MANTSLEQRVDALLRELLHPRNSRLLEQYRFRGSTNRVYRIPMDSAGKEFIVVKLLPHPLVSLKNRVKKIVRNLVNDEHDLSTGRNRAQMEIERAREWQHEGLPIPPLIETTLPEVRVFKGFDYPTFYTILTDKAISKEQKLEALAIVTRQLCFQHMLAWQRNKKSLVHRDPGPWNILVDLENELPYWFDLEQPAEYPRMTIEALMVRAVRIFLYGVLDYLEDQFEQVVETLVENYPLEPVLERFIDIMERRKVSLLNWAIAGLPGRRRHSYLMRQHIAPALRVYLERKRSSANATTKSMHVTWAT